MLRVFSTPKRLYQRLTTMMALTVLTIPLSLTAQSEDDDEEEIITLSPFTVDTSEDRGYLANNAVSGTSLNTAIKDLPMSLEVITADFIQDTGATDFNRLLKKQRFGEWG